VPGCGEHHNVDVGGFEGTPSDLVANEEGIIHSRRIDDDGREAEVVAIEKKIRRLHDIGVQAFVLGTHYAYARPARANVSFKDLGRERRKHVFRPKQFRERRAKPFLRPTAHRIYVLLEELDLEAWHETLRQFADVTSSLHEMLPLIRIEECEFAGHIGWGIGATEMEARNCSGPRIHVGRQKPYPLHESIYKAALARLYLSDDSDSAREAGE
jgi:hypothetical protein